MDGSTHTQREEGLLLVCVWGTASSLCWCLPLSPSDFLSDCCPFISLLLSYTLTENYSILDMLQPENVKEDGGGNVSEWESWWAEFVSLGWEKGTLVHVCLSSLPSLSDMEMLEQGRVELHVKANPPVLLTTLTSMTRNSEEKKSSPKASFPQEKCWAEVIIDLSCADLATCCQTLSKNQE